jgi:cell division protein FtsQ
VTLVLRLRSSASRVRRLGGRRLRLLALVVVGLGIVLGGGWLWFRDSSFVSVKAVTVSGQSGPDAAAIRSALVTAARNMTTLDVDMGELRTVVSPYPAVKSLQVTTDFPHGMRIHVIEQLPVGVIQLGGRTIAVASDGTLLRDMQSAPSLPTIKESVPPGGPRLTDPAAMAAVAALAAAPYQLLSRISQIQTAAPHGLVAQLRAGPQVYLGDPSELTQKWSAAVAVLSDSGSSGAAYIDVSDPRRPAAGAGAAAVAAANGGGSGSNTGNGSSANGG